MSPASPAIAVDYSIYLLEVPLHSTVVPVVVNAGRREKSEEGPCIRGTPQSMKKSTIARRRLTVEDRRFTGAVSPKKGLVWDAGRHHYPLRQAGIDLASNHVEKKLEN